LPRSTNPSRIRENFDLFSPLLQTNDNETAARATATSGAMEDAGVDSHCLLSPNDLTLLDGLQMGGGLAWAQAGFDPIKAP
jgi:hypothetical protein